MAERSYTVELGADMPTPALAAVLARDVPGAIIFAWRALAAEHADTGDYLAGLVPQQSLRYPYLGNPDVVAVVNTSPHADYLENGRAGFHLASRWGARGGRWKIGKDGNLYAHVPFRVKTPFASAGAVHLPGFAARQLSARGLSAGTSRLGSTMPESIYARAKKLGNYGTTRDRLTGTEVEPGGQGYKQSKSYHYFRQAFGPMPAELAGEDGYTWRAGQFEGMFRNTAATPAGGRHTEYMTIRTITPDSPGWYIPPTPALRLADRALDESWDAVRAMIDTAVAQDASAAINDATRGFDQ